MIGADLRGYLQLCITKEGTPELGCRELVFLDVERFQINFFEKHYR